MSRAALCAAFAGIIALAALARERKVAVVVVGGTAEEVAFVRKNAKGYAASGHPVTYEEKPGGGMRVTVTDPNGAEVYAGGDKNAAIVAMVETLTNMPVPGQLIDGGVTLRKFKQYQKTLVMGKKAEGYALAPFKAALKGKKPAEAEEAQAILDSIAKAKARLLYGPRSGDSIRLKISRVVPPRVLAATGRQAGMARAPGTSVLTANGSTTTVCARSTSM